MRLRRFLTSSALLLAFAGTSRADTAPYYDSGELEVSSESTYTVAGQGNENTNSAIANDTLCVHWARGTAAGNTQYTDLRLRCYDLKAKVWSASNITFARTDPSDEAGANPYHEVPAIGFQGGKWWLFNPDHTGNQPCTGNAAPYSYCTGLHTGTADAYASQDSTGTGDCVLASNHSAPYYRTAPLLTTQSTGSWSGSSTPAAGLCWNTDFTAGANQPEIHDIETVSLGNGTMIVHGASTKISGSYTGLHRAILSVDSSGNKKGPYMAIHGGTYSPTTNSACTVTSSGNIFSDSELRYRNGVLWMAWAPRRSFQCSGTGCAGGTARHEYELYLAKSTDGLTWTDMNGGNSFTLTSDESTSRAYNDSNFRIYTGEIDEKSNETFDIDTAGYPVFVIRPYDSATGEPNCAGHPDTQFTSNQYRLALLRWDGSKWINTMIDSTQNWHFKVPMLVIDAANRYWLFRPAGSAFSIPSTAMAYATSTDQGQTWSWTALTQSINTGSNQPRPDNLNAVYDPVRRYFATTYYNSVTDELYVRYFDLLPPLTTGSVLVNPDVMGKTQVPRAY